MRSRLSLTLLLAGGIALPVLGWSMLSPPPKPMNHAAMDGLTQVYSSLADSILANKRCEKATVEAILGVERSAVMQELDEASMGGSSAADHLRAAAEHIGTYATEGGAATTPIRNRLLQGGHHHHADDTGADATYDAGYVVLSKKMKRSLLDVAKRCEMLAESGTPKKEQIDALRSTFSQLADEATKTP